MSIRRFPRARDFRPFSALEVLESRIAPASASSLDLSTLKGFNGFQIDGAAVGDFAGTAVRGAGDVDGDGFDDFMIGAPYANSGGLDRGAVSLLVGRATPFGATLSLANRIDQIRVNGEADSDLAGFALSAAGDINGDGFADIIIGAPGAKGDAAHSGAAYVVFGRASGFSPDLSLSALNGINGFKISGEATGDMAGYFVSAAGDVNGDGFGDLIVGAPEAAGGGTGRGAAYVIYGKASGYTANVPLSSLNGSNGFKMVGEVDGDHLGHAFSKGGDFNGDGLGDVLIGAPGAEGLPAGTATSPGKGYVVFGSATPGPANLDLGTLSGPNGFRIEGENLGDNLGSSLDAIGDLNGDGRPELLIGSPHAQAGGTDRGAAYVLLSTTTAPGPLLQVGMLNGTNGFRLSGVADGDQAGATVSTAGDVNGDGLGDLLVSAPHAHAGGVDRGSTYLVYGRTTGFGADFQLASLDGLSGFRINGEANGDLSGQSIGSAGDINNDGFDDLLIGAPQQSLAGSQSGTSYLVFGHGAKILPGAKIAKFTDADGDRVTVTVTAGTLSHQDFRFGADGTLLQLDLSDDGTEFAQANVTFAVQKVGFGDGKVAVGSVLASVIDLGTVKIKGDLGRIVAGDSTLTTRGLAGLDVLSLGGIGSSTQPDGVVAPLQSAINGKLGLLKVAGSIQNAVVDVTGAIGSVSIGGNLDGSGGGALAGAIRSSGAIGPVAITGSVIGGADFSGIFAGGTLGAVAIKGSLTSADAAHPVTISALGAVGATSSATAVGIASLAIKKDVLNARILAGYDTTLAGINADVSIGAVTVGGKWMASSLVAGVSDSTGDGFGRNDTALSGGSATIFSRIASVVIKGTATGSSDPVSFFGIAAERIGGLTVGTKVFHLTSGQDDLVIDSTNMNFRLEEV